MLDLVQELKDEGVPINGFFDGAEARLEGKRVLLTLRNGETILRQLAFDKKLAGKNCAGYWVHAGSIFFL